MCHVEIDCSNLLWNMIYRVFIRNCVFSQFTATHPLHVGEQFIWVYSHSYWLAIFCTTNSSPVLARERSQNIENSWKKTIFNEHPVCICVRLNPRVLGQGCSDDWSAVSRRRGCHGNDDLRLLEFQLFVKQFTNWFVRQMPL